MKLLEIIKIADEAYGDDLIMQYHKDRDREHGDSLAKFIAIELEETYDDSTDRQEQLYEARRVMNRALEDVGRVLAALENAE